mgnify:CR=1 FL=1
MSLPACLTRKIDRNKIKRQERDREKRQERGTRETVTKERDRDPRETKETERQARKRLEAQSAKTIKRDNSIYYLERQLRYRDERLSNLIPYVPKQFVQRAPSNAN